MKSIDVVLSGIEGDESIMPSITERTYKWAKALVTRKGAPTGFIWHHSAAANSVASTIHKWHIGRGWSGIGYHFVVRKDGMIERGRPEDKIGSHTMHVNDRIGICVEGNLQDSEMPAKQLEAITWLNAYLVDKYGDKPSTRHKDHAKTACPGKNFPWPIPKAKPAPARPAPAKPAPAKPAARPVLRQGSKGEHVTHLQKRLIAHKLALKADGIFGPVTGMRVRQFQKAKGLRVDGIVGPITWARLG